MAMPRYRYAIGQAPVRFPSPASSSTNLASEVAIEDTTTDSLAASQLDEAKTRSKRWSFANFTDDIQQPQRRDRKMSVQAQDNRRRTKSMFNEEVDSKLEVPPMGPGTSRRSSVISTASLETERFKGKMQRKADEKTPLRRGSDLQDMIQHQPRPASTSISSSSRPSSLFWTVPEAEHAQSVPNTSDRTHKPNRSYGAIERISGSAEDDPYGYRALAGPALLPSYHEEQQKQQKLKEVNSRTCGPSIAVIQSKGWILVALSGLLIIVGGLYYLLL